MRRPDLVKYSLEGVMLDMAIGGHCAITMSPGQWDNLLQSAYDSGWILLEVDENEKPIRAYRKPNQ